MPSDPPPPPVAPVPATGATDRFAAPRHLHPASVVLGIDARQLLQAAIFPVVATLASGMALFTVGFLVVLALVGLVIRVLAWQRFRFSFDGEVIRVEEGVLSRNRRTIDVARVQQVEIDRSLLQRSFGLAVLRVETAGSASDIEVDLRVLPEDDAVALRAALRAGKARATGGSPDPALAEDPGATGPDRELLRVPILHVMLAAVTGARLLVFPAVVLAAFQFAGELWTSYVEDTVELVERGLLNAGDLATRPAWTTVALILAATVVLSVVTAILVGVLRDANFRLSRQGDDLHVSRGLLSTRESIVPLRRVQLVEVQRNWMRRPLRFATIRIHSAGGSTDADRRVAIPLLRDHKVDAVLGELLPGVPGVPALTSHPPTALRRSILRWVRPALVPLLLYVGVEWLAPFEAPTWAIWIVAALPVLAIGAGAIEYRVLAHALTDRVVVARSGALSVATTLAPLVKVQAATRQSSWFQRRLGLATVVAHVAGPGGDITVLDAGDDASAELFTRLTEHAASPTPVGPAAEELGVVPST